MIYGWWSSQKFELTIHKNKYMVNIIQNMEPKENNIVLYSFL